MKRQDRKKINHLQPWQFIRCFLKGSPENWCQSESTVFASFVLLITVFLKGFTTGVLTAQQKQTEIIPTDK